MQDVCSSHLDISACSMRSLFRFCAGQIASNKKCLILELGSDVKMLLLNLEIKQGISLTYCQI